MSGCAELEEIHGFKSPSEYGRFHAWLAEKVSLGQLAPIAVQRRYYDGSFDEWWYRCVEDGSVWRLVGPDPPFTGLFEPVDPAHPSGLPFWKSAPGRAVLARQKCGQTEMRPYNRVEELLLASSRGEQPQAAFVAALRDAPLLVIKPPGDQRPAHGDEAGLTLPVVERDGRSYVPAFTSVGQLQVAFPGGSGYFELPARALAESLPAGHWLAINLDGDLGLALDPREILASDAGNAQAVALPAGAQVALGEPAQEPTALLSQLTELARRHREVSAAYRCLMVVRGPDERPQLVIGFLVEAGASTDELLSAAAGLTGEDVLMSVLDPDATSAIDRYMLDETQPFYVAPPA